MAKTKTKLTVRERILKYLDTKCDCVDARTLSKKIKANYNSVRRELGFLLRQRTVFHIDKRSTNSGLKLYYSM